MFGCSIGKAQKLSEALLVVVYRTFAAVEVFLTFACRACVVDAHGVLMEFFMPDGHADPGCDARLNQGQIHACACAPGPFAL